MGCKFQKLADELMWLKINESVVVYYDDPRFLSEMLQSVCNANGHAFSYSVTLFEKGVYRVTKTHGNHKSSKCYHRVPLSYQYN